MSNVMDGIRILEVVEQIYHKSGYPVSTASLCSNCDLPKS